MRDVLRFAAEKDHRSVTSLLHKIRADYLEDAGFSLTENGAAERRRFPRKRVFLPAKTQLHPDEEIDAAPGLILDLSEGGVLLAFQKGSKVKITSIRERSGFEVAFQLPHTQEELSNLYLKIAIAVIGITTHLSIYQYAMTSMAKL